MERGALREVGDPEGLYHRPRTLYGATFVGAGAVLVGRARGNLAHLGPLALPIPPEVGHEEASRVRVLIRPEQVELSSGPPPQPGPPLGQGRIVESSFLGALRRLRIRLPPIPGTRQVAPAPYGEEGLLIDAVLPAEREVPGEEVWVGLRAWHILAPPHPRLLICEPHPPAAEPPVLPRLVQALNAHPSLLGIADTAEEAEALRTALPAHAAAHGLGSAEVKVRRGDPATEIAAELAQSLYDFVILTGEAGARSERGGVLPDLLPRLATPLLVLRGDRPELARILICTAVGEPGKSDIRTGGWLARRLGAEVTLLHVTGEGRAPEPWVAAHLARGVATLRALEVPSRERIRHARTPMEGILAEAAEGSYDLIVLGRHAPRARRPGALFRPATADITLRILAGVDASVLVVPAEE